MADRFANNPSPVTALTTLAANITSTSATTLTVASNTGWPSVTTASGNAFVILIDTEYMRVTDNSTTTWTVTRGIESSAAATHSSGASVWNTYTAGQLEASVRSQNVTAHRHTVLTAAQLAALGTLVNGDRYTTTDESTIASSTWVTGNELDSSSNYVAMTIPSTSTWTNVPGQSILVPAGVPWDCVIQGVISAARNATADATIKSMQMRCVDAATSTIKYGELIWGDVFSTASVTVYDTKGSITPNDPLTADTVVKLQVWALTNANITWTIYAPTTTSVGSLLKAGRR